MQFMYLICVCKNDQFQVKFDLEYVYMRCTKCGKVHRYMIDHDDIPF